MSCLAGPFRLIAPDYPGYGQSSMPPRDEFSYLFENLTTIIDDFIGALRVTKYSIIATKLLPIFEDFYYVDKSPRPGSN